MISGSVVVPFQKGPCGEGGRMRGFLLPLLEAAVVVLVLFLLIFESPPLRQLLNGITIVFGEQLESCLQ